MTGCLGLPSSHSGNVIVVQAGTACAVQSGTAYSRQSGTAIVRSTVWDCETTVWDCLQMCRMRLQIYKQSNSTQVSMIVSVRD